MQLQPTAGGAVSSGTVCGLGVTDALRLDLAQVQVAWLIDELEEVRSPFEEKLQLARGSSADAPDDDAATRSPRRQSTNFGCCA